MLFTMLYVVLVVYVQYTSNIRPVYVQYTESSIEKYRSIKCR